MAKMKQFEDYREEVQDYMSGVVIALKKRGNYDPKVWYMPLQIFAQNLQTWYDCRDRVNEEGIMLTGQRGAIIHPCLCLMNSLQIRIENTVKEFGLSPKALKAIIIEDEEDNFLENLTA